MKLFRLKGLFFAIFFLAASTVEGQTGCNLSLKGLVLDKDTGDPIPFATISIEARNLRVVSAQNGEFDFSGLSVTHSVQEFSTLISPKIK